MCLEEFDITYKQLFSVRVPVDLIWKSKKICMVWLILEDMNGMAGWQGPKSVEDNYSSMNYISKHRQTTFCSWVSTWKQ